MAAKKKSSRGARPSRSGSTHKSGQRIKRAKVRVSRLSTLGPEPARLLAALRDSIKDEISTRIVAHQREVAAIRAKLRRGAQAPLMLLAHGDSWFNYPLTGNGLPLGDTDIIAHLGSMGSPPPKILNISHYGDATTDEMGLIKQQRLIEALQNEKNWLNGKPDAILFSGGGNDIAGDQFCIYLNPKDSGLPALDPDRFAGRLASIQASYLDLFLFRDRYAPQVPIFGHCYDYPHPMKPHPPCTGPWMSPALTFAGWNTEEGTKILRDVLDRFKEMVTGVQASGKYDFTVVPTQGTLEAKDWANELHPYPPGFAKLAQVFLRALTAHFPGRI
jgi:hypothetical protein